MQTINLVKAVRQVRKATEAAEQADRFFSPWWLPEHQAFQDGAQFYDCLTHQLVADYAGHFEGRSVWDIAEEARTLFLSENSGVYGMGEPVDEEMAA
jgi:hypothetical protein